MKRSAEHAASVAGPLDPEPVEDYGVTVGGPMTTSPRSTRPANVQGVREPSFVPMRSRLHRAVDSRAVRGRWKPDT
jgi:hypothetical protein